MLLRLVRELDDGHCTIGQIYCPGGPTFFTLERPWLNNQNGISCIPTGTYHVTWRQRPNKRWTYWLHDVPGRSFILIHSGNIVSHVQGCIMLGLSRGIWQSRERAVFQSTTAVRQFESFMQHEPFTLEVV